MLDFADFVVLNKFDRRGSEDAFRDIRKQVKRNRKLWDTRWTYVSEYFKGFIVYAWCKPMSLPLLIEKGFETGDTCVYVEKKITE